MCGICGRVNLESGKPVDSGSLKAMIQALAHRGPDGEGIWLKGQAGLGHRRLAVIDLSFRSQQPVGIMEDSVVGLFNGEIYNFLSVRKNLESKGVVFDDRGEMEVILRAYEEFGLAFLDHLEGMFALAIWDNRVKQLLLARDRFGKKPLFYRLDKDGIVFSSSLSGLVAEKTFLPELDPVAVNQFVSLNYFPSPQSGLQKVAKLPPGHMLQMCPGQFEVKPYWKADFAAKETSRIEPTTSRFFCVLDRAVEKRLVADVPVGLFLSSGLDSAAILASLAHLGARKVKTYTAGFDDAAFDESGSARRIANWFGVANSKVIIRPPELVSFLNCLVQLSGEPVGDSSLLPTFLLAKAAREEVTVVLNGDGGDECFGGYHRHLASHWVERAGLWGLPNWLTHEAMHLTSLVLGCVQSETVKIWGSRFNRFVQNVCKPLEDQYIHWMLLLKTSEKECLLGERFAKTMRTDLADSFLKSQLKQFDSQSWLNRLFSVEWNTYLAEDLLVKMDRACMAHGLEPRSPFLDQEVVGFAMSLNPSQKIKGLTKKAFLREAMRERLPDWVLRTPKKGFGFPLGSWLRTAWKSSFQEIVFHSKLVQDGWFNSLTVGQWVREHLSGGRDHGYRLWNLLVLETWYCQTQKA